MPSFLAVSVLISAQESHTDCVIVSGTSCSHERLAARPGLQDGDGPMADVVIELADGPRHNTVPFLPRPALSEHRLNDADQEKGLMEVGLGQVKEQIVGYVAKEQIQKALDKHIG